MTAYGRHVRYEECRFRTKSHEVGVAMWSSWVQPINTLPAAGTAKRVRSYARATMMMPPTKTMASTFWESLFFLSLFSSTLYSSFIFFLLVRCIETLHYILVIVSWIFEIFVRFCET